MDKITMKKTPFAFIGVFLLVMLMTFAVVLADENTGTDAVEENDAQNGEEIEADDTEAEEIEIPPELEALQQELVGKELPGPLGGLFGNQRINFHLELDSGKTVVAGIIIQDKVIKNVQIAEVSNPTLEIKTSETVVRSALQSPAPAATLRRALKEKQITVKAIGFGNKLKFKFALGFASISGLFNKEEVASVAVVSREDSGIPAEKSQDVTGGVISEGAKKEGKDKEKND